MSTQTSIGSLIGYAQKIAFDYGFDMDDIWRARLARHIKEELNKGTHPDEIRLAIVGLIERKPVLSPWLLSEKVKDLRRGSVEAGDHLFDMEDIPVHRADPSRFLENEDED